MVGVSKITEVRNKSVNNTLPQSLNSKKDCKPTNPINTRIHPLLFLASKLKDNNHFAKNGKYFSSCHLDLEPIVNQWVTFFRPNKADSDIGWMSIYTKKMRVLNKTCNPIPKNSFIYRCLKSKDPKFQQILQEGEKVLIESYLKAQEFFSDENKEKIPAGFEIIGEKGFGMEASNAGIRVAYSVFSNLLFNIWKNKKHAIDVYKIYFKGSFAHEMTHHIRNELEYKKRHGGVEIPSHAVEVLATDGDFLMHSNKYEHAAKNPNDGLKAYKSYNKDIVRSLILLQKILSKIKDCTYKPKDSTPEELNKAIKSISKDIRQDKLKNIAEEIISIPSKELLKLASSKN